MKFDLDKLNSLYQSTPDNVDLLQVLVIKLQQAQDSRYGELLQTLVEHPEARPAQWGYLLHAYLREKLLSGDIQKSPDDRYDELSKILVKVRKNSLPAQVTRGSILIDLGDFEEGKEMLNKVLAKSSSRTDRLYSHTFIGLAEERLGNLVAARRRAKKAMALAPNDPILSRLGAHLKEMPEPQESGKT
jgi:tetratricopeptide (TPR) repeat protein